MQGWVSISPELAKTHPLYGFGGWLILAAIGHFLSPIRAAIELYPVYSQVEYGTLPPEFQTLLYVEIALNALFMIWSWANIVLMVTLNRFFPASWIALAIGSLILMVGDAIAVKTLLDSLGQPMTWEEVFDPDTIREIARTVVSAAIWIPYALIAKRVNVTYRHRVRADDPILKAKDAPSEAQPLVT